MASDNLNEVGKSLKRTKNDAERAVKKTSPIRPGVERTRDIFDEDVPFEMQFHVAPAQKRVGLDLEFNKPPPMSECLSPYKMQCETFDGLSSGDHEVQTEPYTFGSLAVYVNGSTWPTAKWAELSPENGVLLVTQLPRPTNTLTVCYIEVI